MFSITFYTSSKAPTAFKNLRAYLVFSYDSILSSTTNGNSGTLLTLWPLAKTKGTKEVAAKALSTACLLYLTFTLLCHLLQVFNGWDILPFLH